MAHAIIRQVTSPCSVAGRGKLCLTTLVKWGFCIVISDHRDSSVLTSVTIIYSGQHFATKHFVQYLLIWWILVSSDQIWHRNAQSITHQVMFILRFLSPRSQMRRLYAMMLSVCLSVCCQKRVYKTRFSQNINPLIATLKTYSNTAIGTLAVDGWAVTFGTAMRD